MREASAWLDVAVFTNSPYHPQGRSLLPDFPKSRHFPDAIIPLLQGPVAQLVEQRIENPRVTGSIPVQATKFTP